MIGIVAAVPITFKSRTQELCEADWNRPFMKLWKPLVFVHVVSTVCRDEISKCLLS